MNDEQLNETCPRCGAKGRKVKAVTIESQVTDEAKASLDALDGFRFCPTGDCSVAYYRPEDGALIDKGRTRFPIFQKESSPERLVCYCFQHSVQEIRDEARDSADTQVIQEIKDSCKRGLDDCARNNPQGSCCLGNVSKVVKEAKGLAAAYGNEYGDACGCRSEEEKSVGVAFASESASCCSGDPCESDESLSTLGAKPQENHAPKLALSGALLAAMASSACCWLPLLLIGTGLSAAGVAGFFEAYRMFFVIGSVALLGVGFYFVYFGKPVCEEGSSCATPSSGMRRFTRSMLWVATVLIAGFALFPNALEVWAQNAEEPSAVAAVSNAETKKLAFAVEGMTCEACAIGLNSGLAKLPGVVSAKVDYNSKSATVIAADSVSSETIVKAISALGYAAKRRSE